MESIDKGTINMRARAVALVASEPDAALVYAVLDVATAIREQNDKEQS